jgi:class 3 adenylate cyclase/CheY-like chemotaxis protein
MPNAPEPLHAVVDHAATSAAQHPATPRVVPKVLVVDDTPLNVKLLADLLTVKGYAVATAQSGEEALAGLANELPDIVLLDVMMPGLSGYDVCRRIRANPDTSLLPVVMVTSLDPQQERVHGIDAGADDFLSKPINQPELLARVRSLLRIKSLQDEVRRQAEVLAQWNAELERRVRAQVDELQRLAQLKRFFAPAVADSILSAGDQSILAPHRREICYVFVDLRGFTAFIDAAEPEEVQAVLHDYHGAMGPIIAAHEGTLDRFAGDGILVFFNDPLPTPEPARRAATMALAMRDAFAALRAQWLENGYDLDLGVGIARGYATLGAFGFEGRFDYSAIGGVVNLAARLCGEAKAGQILIDQRLRAALGDAFVIRQVDRMTLKGFAQPVTVFELVARESSERA